MLLIDRDPYRTSMFINAILERMNDESKINPNVISKSDDYKRTLVTRDILTSEHITLADDDMRSILTIASRLEDVREYEAKKFDVVIFHESELVTQEQVFSVLDKFRDMSPKRMYEALEQLKKTRIENSEMYLWMYSDSVEWRWIARPNY